jgi:tripartite-type tricarboxylate transporter receptor subunit TctC
VKRLGTSIAVALLVCLMSGLPAADAVEQSSYPTRPIRLLVGFAGGTAPDIGARVLADKLAASLGKPVVVENVIGASGNIAGDRVAKSEPDGHTLAFAATRGSLALPFGGMDATARVHGGSWWRGGVAAGGARAAATDAYDRDS